MPNSKAPIVLPADPTTALQATTKQYCDLKAPIASPTFTGAVTLPADPSSALQAATKQYADDGPPVSKYPVAEYGWINTSIHPDEMIAVAAAAGSGADAALQVTSGTLEVVRLWCPANKAIIGVSVYCAVAGTGTTTTAYSGTVVYSDSGTLLGNSTRDTTLWTTTGLKNVNLSSTIASQSTGRFVLAGIQVSLPTTAPRFGSGRGISTAFFDSKVGGGRHNRICFQTGQTAATPAASITPSTMSLDNPIMFVGIY
jgi:hypothetical protein